jgi:transcription-repair coupling factor (superfamily II helicase)
VKIQELLGLYSQNEKVNAIASKLNNTKKSKLFAKGLVGSIDALLAACLYQFNFRTQVFIFNNTDDAKYFFADLESLLEGKTILYFPASYKREYQVDLLENNLVLERAETLNRLNQKLNKGDLIHEIDFRSVYATLLKQKFNFDAGQIGITQNALNSLF